MSLSRKTFRRADKNTGITDDVPSITKIINELHQELPHERIVESQLILKLKNI